MGMGLGISWEYGNRTGLPPGRHRVLPARFVAGPCTGFSDPTPIRAIRCMIRRDSLLFATLDIMRVLCEDGSKPMKSNHSVRVQSASVLWQLVPGPQLGRPRAGVNLWPVAELRGRPSS